MSEKKRKVHRPELKAKVGLEALNTINEIGQEYGVLDDNYPDRQSRMP